MFDIPVEDLVFVVCTLVGGGLLLLGLRVELAQRDLEALAAEIGSHIDDNERGERLRLGAEIVVAGPPTENGPSA